MTARHVVEYGNGRRCVCACGRVIRAKTWAGLYRAVVDHVSVGRARGLGPDRMRGAS